MIVITCGLLIDALLLRDRNKFLRLPRLFPNTEVSTLL